MRRGRGSSGGGCPSGVSFPPAFCTWEVAEMSRASFSVSQKLQVFIFLALEINESDFSNLSSALESVQEWQYQARALVPFHG